MGQCLAAFLILAGIVLLCGFWPLGVALIIIGLLVAQLDAVQGKKENADEPVGTRCPRCHGLLHEQPEICQHCRTELYWIDDDQPVTQEQFEEYKKQERYEEEIRQKTSERRSQAAAERRDKLAETGKATVQASATVMSAFGSLIISAGLAIDGIVKKASGEGNEIIYRFFQVLLYVGVPAAIVAAIILSR
jgi:hypothetical protein